MVEPRQVLQSLRQRALRTRVYKEAFRRLTPELLAADGVPGEPNNRFANLDLDAEVLAYFCDDLPQVYQLEQWLPVYQALHRRRPVLVVVRYLATFRYLQDRTDLPLIYVRRLIDFDEILRRVDPKVCLYVNNGARNFQVLGWTRALHAHLNHGESDKLSSASNQAKAYDVVLVAGPAARQRYLDALLGFDGGTLIEVGRPQLDLSFDARLPGSARRTLLYAPTWEGPTEAMNYTSVPVFGPRLVAALVGSGEYRIVYKPHPRVASGSHEVAQAHQRILGALNGANAALAAADRHVIELEAPILSLFPSCDVMLSDVSSVALDWLYLRTEAPLWIIDPRNDRLALLEASPLTAQTYVLDAAGLPDVLTAIRRSLDDDPLRGQREDARRFYFGDLQPGESTRRFLAAVEMVIERRDHLLAERQSAPHPFSSASGMV